MSAKRKPRDATERHGTQNRAERHLYTPMFPFIRDPVQGRRRSLSPLRLRPGNTFGLSCWASGWPHGEWRAIRNPRNANGPQNRGMRRYCAQIFLFVWLLTQGTSPPAAHSGRMIRAAACTTLGVGSNWWVGAQRNPRNATWPQNGPNLR